MQIKFQPYKAFKKAFESKPVKSILMMSVVIGALITIGKFAFDSWNFYYENYADVKNISEKIAKLSAGQSINYFKQVFGNEITGRKIADNKKELIFKYKSSYVQTIADDQDVVLFFSVTDCDNAVKISRPTFMSAHSGDVKIFPDYVELNKTTFEDFFGKSGSEMKYFLSGATANSYYYESVYTGNPGNYQTLFAGVNDICGSKLKSCMLNFKGERCTEDDISNYKKETTITTYGESAPGEGASIIELLESDDNDLFLGPDRIRFRVF